MKQKKAKKQNSAPKTFLQKFKEKPIKQKRRFFIKSALALGVLGVAAGAISGYDAQKKELHDLSVIGQGKPVVLQIHDTSCGICRSLKSRSLQVLDGQSQIEYRIADLATAKGLAVAQKYRVQKTTLLLFDAEGKHVDTVLGLQTTEQLEALFARSFPVQS